MQFLNFCSLCNQHAFNVTVSIIWSYSIPLLWNIGSTIYIKNVVFPIKGESTLNISSTFFQLHKRILFRPSSQNSRRCTRLRITSFATGILSALITGAYFGKTLAYSLLQSSKQTSTLSIDCSVRKNPVTLHLLQRNTVVHNDIDSNEFETAEAARSRQGYY